jgi:hypothetical protein
VNVNARIIDSADANAAFARIGEGAPELRGTAE